MDNELNWYKIEGRISIMQVTDTHHKLPDDG